MIINNQSTALHRNIPIVFLDNVFTENEIDQIKLYFSNKQVRAASIGGSSDNPEGRTDKDIRSSKVFFESVNIENEWFFQKLLKAAEYINERFYRFDLSGFDHLQYTVYDEHGSGYEYHVDMGLHNNELMQHARKLSLSLVLSDNDEYTGGEFKYMLSSEEDIMEQKKGRLIAFPSWLLHKVAPIKLGCRKSLVVWLCGPKFK